MSLSAAELTYLRAGHPHKIIPYLSILVPEIVYCGTVTGSPSKGDRDITVANVSGTIGDIEEGMTVFVGTECGSSSKSRRRFRSRSSQVLTLDENSVVWANGDYITVYKNWELWSVFPRIDETDSYAFYKDYDVTYSDQNEEPPPVAIAGHHQAGFLDGGSVTFPLDASDSYVTASGAAISTYLWECSDGTIAGSTLPTTTISFDAAGTYWIKLTVTDDNGKSQSTYRVIFVHDRTGDNAPYTNFEISSLEGDHDNGGWQVRVTMRGSASNAVIPDRGLIVLWSETWYDTNKIDIGNNDNILFSGYVQDESVQKNRDLSETTFAAATIHRIMDSLKMFSVSLEYNSSPTKWYQYVNLTASRAIHHLWRWHSTLFSICDVFLPISTDTKLVYAIDDFETGSLLSMVENFAYQHGIFAHTCCDRSGRLYTEVDLNIQNDATRAGADVVMAITDADRRADSELVIVRDPRERVAYLVLSGTAFDGSDVTPYCSHAPGDAPHPFGTDSAFDRLILEDQDDANYLSGKLLEISNREIVEFRIAFAGNYFQVLQLMPQVMFSLIVVAGDTNRGITYDGNVMVRNISADFNIQDGTVGIVAVFEPEVPDGVDGEFWQCVGDPVFGSLELPNPSITFPPFPVTPITYPPVIPPDNNLPDIPDAPDIDSGPEIAVVMNQSQLAISTNFNTASPNWTSILPAASSGSLRRLTLSKETNAAVLIEEGGTWGKVFYTADIVASPVVWSTLLDDTSILALLNAQLVPSYPHTLNFVNTLYNNLITGVLTVPTNIVASELIHVVIEVLQSGSPFNDSIAIVLTSPDYGSSWYVHWYEYPAGTYIRFASTAGFRVWQMNRQGYWHGRTYGVARSSGAGGTGIVATQYGIPNGFQGYGGIFKVAPSLEGGLMYGVNTDFELHYTYDQGVTDWSELEVDGVVPVVQAIATQDDGSVYYMSVAGDLYYNHVLYVSLADMYTGSRLTGWLTPYRQNPGMLGLVCGYALATDSVEFVQWLANGIVEDKTGDWKTAIGAWGGTSGSSRAYRNTIIEFPLTEDEL